MPDESELQKVERLVERLEEPTRTALLLGRNLSYGAAGACFLIVLLYAELPARTMASVVSLVGASAGVPLWVAAGAIYDVYRDLGKSGHLYFRSAISKLIINFLQIAASIALLAAVGGLLFSLDGRALIAFASATAAASTLVAMLVARLAADVYGQSAKRASSDGAERERRQ